MCLAYPGKIISINDDKAIVDFNGIEKEVNISLVEAKMGDFINVHAGFAIQVLTEKDAIDIQKLFKDKE